MSHSICVWDTDLDGRAPQWQERARQCLPFACEKFHKVLAFAPMTGEKRRENGLESARDEQAAGVSGARFAGAGFQFAALVVASAFAGIWLDRKVGTSPWLLIVTVFLGAALGFYSMYRNLMRAQRLGDRRTHADRRDSAE